MRNTLKRNDGYVLPYVLIVFLVLSFVAVSICSISLRNLRAQEESVAHTQALYEAEGLVEQIVAQVMVQTGSGASYNSSEEASGKAKDAFWEKVAKLEGDGSQVKIEIPANVNDPLMIKTWNETITVTAGVQVNLKMESSQVDQQYRCSINGADISKYISYDISQTTPVEGGDGT